MKTWIVFTMTLILFFAASGCSNLTGGDSSSGSSANLSLGLGKASFDANAYSLSKVVCDGSSAVSPQHGLMALLYYKPAGGPDITRLDQLETVYTVSEQHLFFNNIDVPTRLFQTGFMTATGDTVKDDQAQTLIENFGLVFKTQFELSPSETSGAYEFSLLSDDGAMLEVQDASGTWQPLINDDGVHPTSMSCSADSANPVLQIDAGKAYAFRLRYFQGPRYHIANVLMWRKVPNPAVNHRDASCGSSGNNYFFDPDHGSVALAPYAALLARGWSVVPAADFYLPTADLSQAQNFNPCFTADSPQITNAQILSAGNGQVTVQWTTDRPATSQAIVKKSNGDLVASSVSDNVLRTEHVVTVANLPAGVSLEVQVVSYSENQGLAMSSGIGFTL